MELENINWGFDYVIKDIERDKLEKTKAFSFLLERWNRYYPNEQITSGKEKLINSGDPICFLDSNNRNFPFQILLADSSNVHPFNAVFDTCYALGIHINEKDLKEFLKYISVKPNKKWAQLQIDKMRRETEKEIFEIKKAYEIK